MQAEFGGDLPAWIETAVLEAASRPLAKALSSMLGPGESEAIALAAGQPGAVTILDDQRARRVARDMASD